MKPEDKLLFACTRQKFLETHQQTVLDLCHRETINWNIIYSNAQAHGVASLVYINLQHCDLLSLGIPQAIIDQFRRYHYGSIIKKERRAEKLKQSLAFFQQEAIDVMLIKGAALDILVYEQPWYTVPHDIDAVLKLKVDEISDSTKTSLAKSLNGSGIEYDYFEHHDMSMNGALLVDFNQIWNDAIKTEFQGHPVWVMCPEDMLLSVAINSCRKRFFRLKSLCDMAETIDKCNDLNWTRLTDKSKAYDCTEILYAALLVTKITLDCKLPDSILTNLDVNPTRALIIRYLSQGMSLSAFSSLFSEKTLFGRKISSALLLPYATYHWDQIWRKMKYVWATRSA